MTPDAPRPDLDAAERDEAEREAAASWALREINRLRAALADARAEVARLRAAVDAVRQLHQSCEVTLQSGRVIQMCGHCSETGDPYHTVSDDWPCPTMLAVAPAPAEEEAQ